MTFLCFLCPLSLCVSVYAPSVHYPLRRHSLLLECTYRKSCSLYLSNYASEACMQRSRAELSLNFSLNLSSAFRIANVSLHGKVARNIRGQASPAQLTSGRYEADMRYEIRLIQLL